MRDSGVFRTAAVLGQVGCSKCCCRGPVWFLLPGLAPVVVDEDVLPYDGVQPCLQVRVGLKAVFCR